MAAAGAGGHGAGRVAADLRVVMEHLVPESALRIGGVDVVLPLGQIAERVGMELLRRSPPR